MNSTDNETSTSGETSRELETPVTDRHRDYGRPGDQIAARWFVLGLVVYFGLAVAVVGGGLLSGDRKALLQFVGYSSAGWNASVTIVVSMSLSITIAVLFAARKDIRFLRREEEDITWFIKNGAQRALYLLVAPDKRAAAMRSSTLPPETEWRAPTLLSERIRSVYQANMQAEGSAPTIEQLHFIAESRTARYGQAPRYAAGLLLLLTVLGTFSGVKSALPALISAVDSPDAKNITEPLAAVAEAFGSNSFALIGAIALGLVAHGFALGRLHLLERLEIVSDDVLASSTEAGTARPLEAATRSLEKAANRLADSQHSFEDIASAIDRLEKTTSDSFGGLSSTLSELGSKTDEDFFRHSEKLFAAVELRLGRLEDAVTATAEVYGAIVADLHRKTFETQAAVLALSNANANLASGLQRTEGLSQGLDQSVVAIAATAETMRSTAVALDTTVDRMRNEMGGLLEALRESPLRAEAPLVKVLSGLTAAVESQRSFDTRGEILSALGRINTTLQRTETSSGKPIQTPAANLVQTSGIDKESLDLSLAPLIEEMTRFQRTFDRYLKREGKRQLLDFAMLLGTVVAGWLLVRSFVH